MNWIVSVLFFLSAVHCAVAQEAADQLEKSSHCGEKLRHCHTWNTVFGILTPVFLVTNIITVLWVARDPIIAAFRNLAGRFATHSPLIEEN